MPTFHSLEALLVDQLRELFSAEIQLLQAWPMMADAASSVDLKEAFKTHGDQTEQHAERIRQSIRNLGEAPEGKNCTAMAGLIGEAMEIGHAAGDGVVKDIALIAAAQKCKHYEMAGYGSARTLAALLGEDDILENIQLTLEEEEFTDKLLSGIAEEQNVEAIPSAAINRA